MLFDHYWSEAEALCELGLLCRSRYSAEGAFIFIRDDGERTAAATVESFRSKVATRRGERVCWFVPPFRWPHEGTTHRLSSSPARYARDKITLICIISVMWMVEKIVALMTEKDEIHLLSP